MIRVPPQPAQEPEPSRRRLWHQGPGDADCRWNLFSRYCRPVGQVIFANWLATTSSKGLLRHTNLATTTPQYVKDVPKNTLSAMNLLETLFNECSTAGTTSLTK